MLIATEGQRWMLDALLSGTTQNQIAEAAGVSQSAVSQWLRGRNAPDYKRRCAMRDAFGVKTDAWDEMLTEPFERDLGVRRSQGYRAMRHAD